MRFGQPGKVEISGAVEAFNLAGTGTLEIRGDTVVLTGSSRRSFRLSQREEHTLARHDICNVQCAGTRIRFDCTALDGTQGYVVLNAVDAVRIVELLPDRRTEAFVADHIDREDFRQRLDRLCPRARVTPALVAINLFVFALMVSDGVGLFLVHPDVATKWGSNFAPLTMGGQWWRLLTALFIHFGILHVALNMWVLYLSGTMTERLYGSARFAVIYVFAGLVGGMVSLLSNPGVNSAGASGAIFGVFGAMLAFVVNPRNGVPRSIMIEHRNSTLAFAAYSLFYGFAHAGIDNAAHVGGLLGGLLMGLLLARPLDDAHRASRGIAGLVGATAAGVLTLGLLLRPLLNPTDAVRNRQAFERAMLEFPSREQRAAQAVRDALPLAASPNRETEVRFARLMGVDAYAQWNALYEAMAEPKLAATDPMAAEQALVLRYVEGRRRYCQLTAKAMLQNDAATEEQAQAANQDAEATIGKLQQLDVERGR